MKVPADDGDIRSAWKCGCGKRFVDEGEARAHIGPGHPWVSRMIDEAMCFLHDGEGDDWMFAEVMAEDVRELDKKFPSPNQG